MHSVTREQNGLEANCKNIHKNPKGKEYEQEICATAPNFYSSNEFHST